MTVCTHCGKKYNPENHSHKIGFWEGDTTPCPNCGRVN